MVKLTDYIKSVYDNDSSAIIICDLNHNIVYANKAAEDLYYEMKLVGENHFNEFDEKFKRLVDHVITWFNLSVKNNRVHTYYSEKTNTDYFIEALRDPYGKVIGYLGKSQKKNSDSPCLYDFLTLNEIIWQQPI